MGPSHGSGQGWAASRVWTQLDSPPSPRTRAVCVCFLALWWEGPAKVRDLSLPQAPLVSNGSFNQAGGAGAGDIAAAVCALAAVSSGLWRNSLSGSLELGFQVSGGRPGLSRPAQAFTPGPPAGQRLNLATS